jgi:hypothetical protein
MDKTSALKQAFMQALEESKHEIIGKSTPKVVSQVMDKILELEEYGKSPEAIHTMQEGKLVEALYFCHAIAINKYADLVIQMIKDGLFLVNADALENTVWDKFNKSINEGDDNA